MAMVAGGDDGDGGEDGDSSSDSISRYCEDGVTICRVFD